MKSRGDLYKCDEPECTKKTNNASGYCISHQPVCKIKGCNIRINPRRGFSYCAGHRKKKTDPKTVYICEITGET